MNNEERKQLAAFLRSKIHQCYLPGYYFSNNDVLEEIDNYFKVKELITERDKIQEQIDDLTK